MRALGAARRAELARAVEDLDRAEEVVAAAHGGAMLGDGVGIYYARALAVT